MTAPSPSLPPLVVIGASGGVGASSLALAVGRRLAVTEPPSLVVDLDLDGGGLDVTAGVEHSPGRRWSDFAESLGHIPSSGILTSLPFDDRCHLLSAGGPAPRPVSADAVLGVLASLRTGPARMVLDCPRASPLLADVTAHGALVVLVTGLSSRSLADLDAALERVLDVGAPSSSPPLELRLVTRGGRPTPDVVEDLVAHAAVAHVHHVPDDPRVAREGERGRWPGSGRDSLRRAADVLAEVVGACAVAS
jgi:hypothetical protein